ncbi:MAG: hypothetical protein R3C68_10500 [Myxococcota bacterium]
MADKLTTERLNSFWHTEANPDIDADETQFIIESIADKSLLPEVLGSIDSLVNAMDSGEVAIAPENRLAILEALKSSGTKGNTTSLKQNLLAGQMVNDAQIAQMTVKQRADVIGGAIEQEVKTLGALSLRLLENASDAQVSLLLCCLKDQSMLGNWREALGSDADNLLHYLDTRREGLTPEGMSRLQFFRAGGWESAELLPPGDPKRDAANFEIFMKRFNSGSGLMDLEGGNIGIGEAGLDLEMYDYDKEDGFPPFHPDAPFITALGQLREPFFRRVVEKMDDETRKAYLYHKFGDTFFKYYDHGQYLFEEGGSLVRGHNHKTPLMPGSHDDRAFPVDFKLNSREIEASYWKASPEKRDRKDLIHQIRFLQALPGVVRGDGFIEKFLPDLLSTITEPGDLWILSQVRLLQNDAQHAKLQRVIAAKLAE